MLLVSRYQFNLQVTGYLSISESKVAHLLHTSVIHRTQEIVCRHLKIYEKLEK